MKDGLLDDAIDSWCEDVKDHKTFHEFCIDHQAIWCGLCSGSRCPQCIEDPHCRHCHVPLNEEDHEWDCPNAD